MADENTNELDDLSRIPGDTEGAGDDGDDEDRAARRRKRGELFESVKELTEQNRRSGEQLAELRGIVTGLAQRMQPTQQPPQVDEFEARVQELKGLRRAEMKAFAARPPAMGPEYDQFEDRIDGYDQQIQELRAAKVVAHHEASRPRPQAPAPMGPEAAQLAREFPDLISFKDPVTGENTAAKWVKNHMENEMLEGKPLTMESVRARMKEARQRVARIPNSASAGEQSPYRGAGAGPTQFEAPPGKTEVTEAHKEWARNLYPNMSEGEAVKKYAQHYLKKAAG